ncbi:pyridoxamine 5'-phosphate oxidase [Kribbella kalugense]|uniref:PPOX class probable F420-dependent enzyme n=1 Tax=Kribbella kalugense TaxID=2512221 RepID=A0A4V3G6I0_9ACTN|nr:pyridoxamine 5'-phosphate oxidase [Kribbella kalugense]TDW15184.1 PPOX class probable F420-dependent enzyme [Kribbella kalugense]
METRAGLERINELGRRDHFLAVAITQRRSGEPAATVVNAGVLDHPLTGEPVVAFVARGRTAKLTHLRRTPTATLVFRAGWEWIGVSGSVELTGPDDPLPGIDAERLRVLLRDIYQAAGGVHPDLDEYDREMIADRRTAVLIRPDRFINNPAGGDRQETE